MLTVMKRNGNEESGVSTMADVRPIDAYALKDYYGRWSDDQTEFLKCEIDRYIDAQPTINPDDLRPRGRWITHNNGITECSECHTLGSPQWKCCPVCTAMMDGKENEDA